MDPTRASYIAVIEQYNRITYRIHLVNDRPELVHCWTRVAIEDRARSIASTNHRRFSLEFADLFPCGKPSETLCEGRNGVPSVQTHETNRRGRFRPSPARNEASFCSWPPGSKRIQISTRHALTRGNCLASLSFARGAWPLRRAALNRCAEPYVFPVSRFKPRPRASLLSCVLDDIVSSR